jgi:hypothetical protein
MGCGIFIKTFELRTVAIAIIEGFSSFLYAYCFDPTTTLELANGKFLVFLVFKDLHVISKCYDPLVTLKNYYLSHDGKF